MQKVRVAGAGMSKFGKFLDRGLRDLAEEAVRDTLEDTGIDVREINAAYVSNSVAGLITGQETIRGQVVLRKTGLMGIPIVNVENACASASTAFHLGWTAVASGMYDCVLALGVEKLSDPDKAKSFRAFNAAVDITELAELEKQLGRGGAEAKDRSLFMDLYLSMLNPDEPASQEVVGGITREQMALVSVKNHYHGSLNPYAQYREEVTLEQVLQSRPVVGPLTVLMCSPLGDGAAAALIVSEEFARNKGLKGPKVDASVLVSGRADDRSMAPSSRRAAMQAYEMAGIGPEDIDFAEVHDAVAPAEISIYEDLRFCAPGEGPKLIEDRVTWLGGRLPVNTSGGLLSRGHPIGATGLGQIAEVVWQLQGKGGKRQVENCKVGLTQNGGGHIGFDAAAMAVHIFSV
ncbi:MAG TPA: thiolase family protein [Ktedonobacteraceae bacterium]|nr:thiolase family protein [Ktedonobacteraceae bacterium]